MFKFFQNLWEYFFSPWNIEIIERNNELRVKRHPCILADGFETKTLRAYIICKYTHKFDKREKIVKKYLD